MEDHETGTIDEDEACIEKELDDKTLNDNNDYDISFSHAPLTINLFGLTLHSLFDALVCNECQNCNSGNLDVLRTDRTTLPKHPLSFANKPLGHLYG